MPKFVVCSGYCHFCLIVGCHSLLLSIFLICLFIFFSFFFRGPLVLAPGNGSDCTSLFLDGQFCIKSIDQFSTQLYPVHIFNVERYVGWGCVLNCFMLSPLMHYLVSLLWLICYPHILLNF